MDGSSVRTIANKSADFKTKEIQWGYIPMPRPERFEIQFDSPGKIYLANEIITGKVVLKISEPLSLKGVKMRFKGECSIHFSEAKSKVRQSTNFKYLKRKLTSIGMRTKDGFDENEKELQIFREQSPQMKGIEKDDCSIINVMGTVNPGYIPDEDEQREEWKESSENSLYAPQKLWTAASTNYRPKSTESVWFEGMMKGPTQHYQALETYFDCEFYIYGHKYQNGEREMLPAGLHRFPFAFNLPPNLPSSFNGGKGIIRYLSAAVLDRPAAANLVKKAGFSVLSILDLNMDSHASSHCSRSNALNPCGIFCNRGPISLSISVPRRGYVPGESIIVYAEIDNISGSNTKSTRLTFYQIITFMMPNNLKTYRVERIIREIVRGPLLPGESDYWKNVHIHIPPVAPNNLHLTCRLMKLEYMLEMAVELPRPWKNLHVSIPIEIGTIPLRTTFSSFQPLNDDSTNPLIKLPGIKYPNFPSYTCGDCFFGQESLEKQYENISGDKEYMGPPYEHDTPYAPTYLVYCPKCNPSRSPSVSSDMS